MSSVKSNERDKSEPISINHVSTVDTYFTERDIEIELERGKSIPSIFPETIVLTVITHGGYDIKKTDGVVKIPTFTFSDIGIEPLINDMGYVEDTGAYTLRTITAAPVGITFYHDEYMIQSYIDNIHHKFSSYQPDGLTEEEKQDKLDNITSRISRGLKNIDKERIEHYEKDARSGRESKEEVHEMSQFAIYHRDEMYWTRTYKSNEFPTIKDKEFTVNPNKIVEPEYKHLDSRINIVNIPGMPDLFDDTIFEGLEMRHTSNSKRVYMSKLIKYLYNNGVKNVILVDFSCSVCGYSRDNLTERDLRNLRRGFGKKTRKNKAKTRKSFFTKRRRNKTRQHKNRYTHRPIR
jgi:hypothetical protein